jgi:ATP-dependent DNA helicase RecQ
VRAADLRQKYHLLRPESDAASLVQSLQTRFDRREAAELHRIQDVLNLVEHDGCQTNALVGYFGEEREDDCGHCSFCRTQRRALLPPPAEHAPVETAIDRNQLKSLTALHPAALSTPRQMARFLCGLSSPAAGKSRLNREELFGRLETYRFAEVLEWCENL